VAKQMVAREELNTLHAGVLRDDREAIEAVGKVVFDRAFRVLRGHWRGVDSDLINDAVEDALLAYFGAPGRYDSSRARLDTFIVAMASHRLRTLLRSQRRRRIAEERLSKSAITPAMVLLTDRVRTAVRVKLTDSERRFLEARMAGERRTPELARLIGSDDVPIDQQRLIVKRMTERLRLRLRRLGGNLRRRAAVGSGIDR
jgi:hypothetical protein